MSQNTHVVSAPNYAHQFACIGGACPQTCCAGWSVDIDKSNFKAIKKVKASAALTQKINQFINPLNDAKSPVQFARMQMLPDESCPMLNADKLCDIQLELGEDYLSKTCRHYPRSVNSLSSRREMYLTLSCPEAARLCLLQQAEWSHGPLDTKIPIGKPIPVRSLSTNLDVIQNLVLISGFDLLRDFMFYCIQYQGAPLWHRIMLIGLTLKKITACPETEWKQKDFLESQLLPAKLDLITGAFSSELTQRIDLSGQVEVQSKLIQAMTNLRVMMIAPERKASFSPQFRELVMRSFEAYNLLVQNDRALVHGRLSASMASFESQAPRFFENYLCNAVGKEGGNFCDVTRMEGVWLKISLRLALLRFYLKGLTASAGGLSTDDAIKMVYAFTKVIEHNSSYEKAVESLLSEDQMDGMASVAIMLA